MDSSMESQQLSDRHVARARPVSGRTYAGGYMLLRLGWLVLVLFDLSLFMASLPSFYDRALQSPFINDPGVRQNLARAGISVGTYVLLQAIPIICGAIVSTIVGVIVFRGRSANPMALFVSLVLILFFARPDLEWTRSLPPLLAQSAGWVSLLGLLAIGPFFYLFPDGRWVPRWTRWLAIWWVVFNATVTFGPQPTPGQAPSPAFLVPYLLSLFVLGSSFIVAPVYRYWRVSGPVQRQQTKWVVFGMLLLLVPGLAGISLTLIFPAAFAGGSLPYVLGQFVLTLALAGIPLTIGLAVLRYRLYDVDLLINRTLVYTLLTAVLATVYGGGVVLFQQLFRPWLGRENDLAVVASTLLIAALFHPLRRRIQGGIDRRFFRRKYDAAQILAAFSQRLRSELDLEDVRADMLGVVEETLRPERMSLWLRKPR